ncbi:Uncharacterised protein [Mycobacterium tuberculosis]|nr:Uncharacterised protein [Mycobacterium tuberculosis]
MRQCRRDGVEVDQFDGGPIGLGELTGYPLPAELQKPAPMAERFHPVGHTRILLGDHDAHLAIRVRLGLAGIQRGLMIDIVQRDVPHAAQLKP